MAHLKKPNADDNDVEAKFESYKDFGETVRKEYEEVYTGMWSSLSVAHLEPFGKIILERENKVLKNQDQLIESIRKNLQQTMVSALNNFWQNNGVSEAIISLEMCKDKFKSYEGHKWDMESKTPMERTRPMRMRFKQNRLRYLQAQLNYQEQQLEEAFKENMTWRQKIQDVKQQRIFLMESMDQYRQKFAAAKQEIMRLQEQMLDQEESEISSNSSKVVADVDKEACI